eukprot:1152211-Pelagomonas_calceolata.AAC.3
MSMPAAIPSQKGSPMAAMPVLTIGCGIPPLADSFSRDTQQRSLSIDFSSSPVLRVGIVDFLLLMPAAILLSVLYLPYVPFGATLDTFDDFALSDTSIPCPRETVMHA